MDNAKDKNMKRTSINNNHLRKIWDQRADMHFARKMCKTEDKCSKLYDKSWWSYIEPHLSKIKNGRILEAGCGTGRWAERLAPMGFEMVLSDLSPKMLHYAQDYAEQHGFADKLSFEELDICDMHSLLNNSFDMVLSTGEPLTMCANPEKAISELCRVVRPGGYLICDAGNRYRKVFDLSHRKEFDQILKVLETGNYVPENGLTQHLLGPEELVEILKANKMEVHNLAGITPMFSFPPDSELKDALEHESIFRDMLEISETYAERPGIVNLSSRLLAVARKPKLK